MPSKPRIPAELFQNLSKILYKKSNLEFTLENPTRFFNFRQEIRNPSKIPQNRKSTEIPTVSGIGFESGWASSVLM